MIDSTLRGVPNVELTVKYKTYSSGLGPGKSEKGYSGTGITDELGNFVVKSELMMDAEYELLPVYINIWDC
ncbi:MAG: hypothetical protein QM642_09685 [Edaphocola sp.]